MGVHHPLPQRALLKALRAPCQRRNYGHSFSFLAHSTKKIYCKIDTQKWAPQIPSGGGGVPFEWCDPCSKRKTLGRGSLWGQEKMSLKFKKKYTPLKKNKSPLQDWGKSTKMDLPLKLGKFLQNGWFFDTLHVLPILHLLTVSTSGQFCSLPRIVLVWPIFAIWMFWIAWFSSTSCGICKVMPRPLQHRTG